MLICADDAEWSDKQPSAADGAASSDEDDDDDDEDDDDDDSVANSDYSLHRDDSDAFDYVRVQLPMGGHGDNIAKSPLTANQVRNSTHYHIDVRIGSTISSPAFSSLLIFPHFGSTVSGPAYSILWFLMTFGAVFSGSALSVPPPPVRPLGSSTTELTRSPFVDPTHPTHHHTDTDLAHNNNTP